MQENRVRSEEPLSSVLFLSNYDAKGFQDKILAGALNTGCKMNEKKPHIHKNSHVPGSQLWPNPPLAAGDLNRNTSDSAKAFPEEPAHSSSAVTPGPPCLGRVCQG